MKSVLEQFKHHGIHASIHYADDSGKEWGQANKEKQKALSLFDEHPELEDEMRKISKEFLWSLNFEVRLRKEKAASKMNIKEGEK